MTTDIFIKTYPGDFPWLDFCFRSIDKFARGFRRVIVVSPEQIPYHPKNVNFEVVLIPDASNGYLWQQVIKLNADKYTDADYICFMDSDTMFIKRGTPEDLFDEVSPICHQPKCMMTPYTEIQTPWKPITEKFLGLPVNYEFMRRFPLTYPNFLFRMLRKFCKAKHGKDIDDYVMENDFSEFNALGAFAWEFYPGALSWIDTSVIPPEHWPPLIVKQSWSKGGITDETRRACEEVLA
jgi:hypothetical protein